MAVNQTKMLIVDPDVFKAELLESIANLLADRQTPPTADPLPELLTIKQAAAFLQCSVGTIQNWSRAGILEKHYVGNSPRFRRDDLRAAFERNETQRIKRA